MFGGLDTLLRGGLCATKGKDVRSLPRRRCRCRRCPSSRYTWIAIDTRTVRLSRHSRGTAYSTPAQTPPSTPSTRTLRELNRHADGCLTDAAKFPRDVRPVGKAIVSWKVMDSRDCLPRATRAVRQTLLLRRRHRAVAWRGDCHVAGVRTRREHFAIACFV
jgi:hypothetical protein